MGEARVVVCHGGSGTVYGALAVGVPLVVMPIRGDNIANAATVVRAIAAEMATAPTITTLLNRLPHLLGFSRRPLHD